MNKEITPVATRLSEETNTLDPARLMESFLEAINNLCGRDNLITMPRPTK